MKQHLPDGEELLSDVPQSAENLLTLAIFIKHRTIQPTPRCYFRHNQGGGRIRLWPENIQQQLWQIGLGENRPRW